MDKRMSGFSRSRQRRSQPAAHINRNVGLAGAAALVAGCFAPVVQIVGQNHSLVSLDDGIKALFILTIAALGAAMILMKKVAGTYITGGAALVFSAIYFAEIKDRLDAAKGDVSGLAAGYDSALADAIGQAVHSSASLGWAWALLFIGAALIALSPKL